MGFGSMLKDYLDYHKISQTDFALRLGISTKHMNEIINGNSDISLELMHAINLLTGIDINLIFYAENRKKMANYLQTNFKTEANIKSFLNSFYLKEMSQNKWLVLKDKESNIQNALDLLEFLNIKDFNLLNNYLDKRILYKKKDDANLKKIYLWIKYCDKQALKEEVNVYQSSNLVNLLEDLKKVQNEKFNESKLIKLFNKYGIYLVIEEALKGTKIRGCTMIKNTNPAIYITKYLKEKSSFYFTLYHEIGHIKTDYNQAKNKILISDLNNEDKCDEFALNAMISKEVWQEILQNYDAKNKICQAHKIPLCFLYSRLAYAGYIKYNSKEYNNYKEVIY